MQNLVGQVVPSEDEIQKLIKEVAAIDAKIAKIVDVHLSPEHKKTMLKFRPGGEKIVALVGRLAEERGVEIPGVSVDEMTADLTLAERLRPLLAASESLHKRIDDGLFEAESECWQAATALYSVLGSISHRDPQLASAIQPAIDFFATGRRRPKNPPSSPSK